MGLYINVEHIPYEDGFDRVNGNEHFINGIETMQEWIRSQESIEIVRCNDCKHWHTNLCRINGFNSLIFATRDSDYCSYGEKKEGR